MVFLCIQSSCDIRFHIVATGKSQNWVKCPSLSVCIETTCTCKLLYETIKGEQTVLSIQTRCNI